VYVCGDEPVLLEPQRLRTHLRNPLICQVEFTVGEVAYRAQEAMVAFFGESLGVICQRLRVSAE
jgi:hypothetical protein